MELSNSNSIPSIIISKSWLYSFFNVYDGDVECCRVGVDEGFMDGAVLGTIEGRLDVDGIDDGKIVGSNDGASDKLFDGDDEVEGFIDDVWEDDGLSEGCIDGWVLGATVPSDCCSRDNDNRSSLFLLILLTFDLKA